MDNKKVEKVLKEIFDKCGTEIVQNRKKFRSVVYDLLDEWTYKDERIVLKLAMESNAIPILLSTPRITSDAAERAVEQIRKETHMDSEDAKFVVQCVVAACGFSPDIVTENEKRRQAEKIEQERIQKEEEQKRQKELRKQKREEKKRQEEERRQKEEEQKRKEGQKRQREERKKQEEERKQREKQKQRELMLPVGDFEYTVYDDCVVIDKYKGNVAAVVIPSEIAGKAVTQIGKNAFRGCSSLTSLKMPKSVITIIDQYAFYKCSSLTSIAIPKSVMIIGQYAFCNCSSLTSIIIPNSIRRIGEYAFWGCSNLVNVMIPKHIINIDDTIFKNCPNLTITRY